MTLEQWEQEIIREALRQANGNKSQAARALTRLRELTGDTGEHDATSERGTARHE